MPALRELQMQFAAALFEDAGSAPVQLPILPHGIEPDARLDIYRNNLREGFTKALAIEFPVIERLVGTEYFRQLAQAFLVEHPSRAGNLHHIGAPFPEFLRKRFDAGQYAYLSDVAALEWAYQQVMIAADAAPLAVEALREVSPAQYEHLRLALHPACALVPSVYPIVRIWQANQPDSTGEEIIDLDAGGDNVLLVRTPEAVELHRLAPGELAALDALGQGLPLGSALDAALASDQAFDIGAALRRFMDLHLFVGLHLPDAARDTINGTACSAD